MEVAESRLRHNALLSTVTRGRVGLSSSTTPLYNKAQGKDMRALMQDEVSASVMEEQTSRMAAGSLDKMGASSGLQGLMS